MKGVKIKQALLGNAIDVYALLKEAADEGVFPEDQQPTSKELQHYYLTGLLKEMTSPHHIYLLAQRGRGFLGYAHAMIAPDRWGGTNLTIMLDMVYVVKKRRKMGIGKAMIDEIKKLAEKHDIKRIVLLGKDDMLEYWQKQGAKSLSNYMEVVV